MKSMLVLIKAKNQPLKPTMFHFNISTSETNGKKKKSGKTLFFMCWKNTNTKKVIFSKKKKKKFRSKTKMFFKINNTWGDLIQIKIKNYAEPSDITFFQTKFFFFHIWNWVNWEKNKKIKNQCSVCERGWKKGQKNKKILLNFIYIYFLCEQSEQNVFRKNNCFAGFF